MGRPRAGHGWTWFTRNGKIITIISNDAGHWITTGEATNWRRCIRCRRPFENDPFDSGACPICYFYKMIPQGTFWDHKNHYLFPYNCGRRSMAHTFDRRPLEDQKVNWRAYLRTQQFQPQ